MSHSRLGREGGCEKVVVADGWSRCPEAWMYRRLRETRSGEGPDSGAGVGAWGHGGARGLGPERKLRSFKLWRTPNAMLRDFDI